MTTHRRPDHRAEDVSDSERILEIRVTCGSVDVADRIAEALIAGRGAACVHRSAIDSRYEWEGRLVAETEILLEIITTDAARWRAVEIIVDHHTYDLPAIVWMPLDCTADYARWVAEQTDPER